MTYRTETIEQELVDLVRKLPPDRAAEVRDFAEFLFTRNTTDTDLSDKKLSDWDRQAEQIDREQLAYEAQHAQLREQYEGKYIAMHRSEVIDHDLDRTALRRRVRKQYGNTPILITLVEKEPIQTFWIRSPRLVVDEP